MRGTRAGTYKITAYRVPPPIIRQPSKKFNCCRPDSCYYIDWRKWLVENLSRVV